MTKDVRDSWFYEVIVSASTGQVVVASHKRDQSIKNDFQYEWVMAVHFDRIENPKADQEEDQEKPSTPRAKMGASMLTSSSSSVPSSPSKPKKNIDEDSRRARRDKRAQLEAKRKEKEDRRAKRAASAASRNNKDGEGDDEPEEDGYSTSDESDDEELISSDGSEESLSSSLEGSKHSKDNGNAKKKNGTTGTHTSGGSNATTPTTRPQRESSAEDQRSNDHQSQQTNTESILSRSKQSNDGLGTSSAVIFGSQTMDLPASPAEEARSASKDNEDSQHGSASHSSRHPSNIPSSGSSEATPRPDGGDSSFSTAKVPQGSEDLSTNVGAVEGVDSHATDASTATLSTMDVSKAISPEKILCRPLDFGYKCTNVSLTVTDLMFSLPLHTTQQAKRTEISKILEPYASPDVMELSFSRNWEFFPASASAELFGQAGSTSREGSTTDVNGGSTGGGSAVSLISSSSSVPGSTSASAMHGGGGAGGVPHLSVSGGLQTLGGVTGQGVSSSHSDISSGQNTPSLNHSTALSGSSTSIGQQSPRFSTPHGSAAHSLTGSIHLLGASMGGSSSSVGSSTQSSSTSLIQQTPPPIVQGIKEYDNGDRYEGGLCLGIREGYGKYTCSATKVVYEGGYKDGKRHGVGKYAFASGALVQGTFQRGILVHGSYSFPNGDAYTGDFKDDKFDGQGEWLGASGDIYKGAWKGGLRHGLGEAKLSHGDSYHGEFQNDSIHGFGKYHFANGDLFNGQFSQGLIHGVGEYTFHASGKVLLGEFAQGKLIKSSAITNPTQQPTSSSQTLSTPPTAATTNLAMSPSNEALAPTNTETTSSNNISSSSSSSSSAPTMPSLGPSVVMGGGIVPIPEEEPTTPTTPTSTPRS
jgi:hypothetical protein